VCIFVKTVEPAIKSSIIDICQCFGLAEFCVLKNCSIGAELVQCELFGSVFLNLAKYLLYLILKMYIKC